MGENRQIGTSTFTVRVEIFLFIFFYARGALPPVPELDWLHSWWCPSAS